jgi:hypothetical protein
VCWFVCGCDGPEGKKVLTDVNSYSKVQEIRDFVFFFACLTWYKCIRKCKFYSISICFAEHLENKPHRSSKYIEFVCTWCLYVCQLVLLQIPLRVFHSWYRHFSGNWQFSIMEFWTLFRNKDRHWFRLWVAIQLLLMLRKGIRYTQNLRWVWKFRSYICVS